MDANRMGTFIGERRKLKKLSQQELADILHLSNRTISKWECGKGIPDSSIMLKLCGALDINVYELLCGENTPKEKNKYLGDRIKDKRISRGLSIDEMSKLTNISINTLYKIELGDFMPNVEGLVSICKALETTPNDMLLDTLLENPVASESTTRDLASYDSKNLSWEEKVNYVSALKKERKKIYSAIIQRKLGVGYMEAKALIDEIEREGEKWKEQQQ